MSFESVAISETADIVRARGAARTLAAQAGFNLADQTRLATAVSELSRNALNYAGGGVCQITDHSCDRHRRIRVVVEDHGPGIPDITRATEDGYSTGGGLGAGLPGTKRLMDVFEIESRPGHTRVQVELVRPK
ncbi:ATP-binding protein [Limnobacter sp.]|uniref:ATP-binding protein n=1 Tax=Limnobacter sp. TaxID=2003368 RepID=UPI003518010D